MSNKQVGILGEQLVARVLERRGHRILHRNYWTRWAEIDLLTQINTELWIIEVKTRSTERFGTPQEAVRSHKLAKLRLFGRTLAQRAEFEHLTIRCVVAAVTLTPSPRVKLINLEALTIT